MCNVTGMLYVADNIKKEDITGKDVLEVGAYNVNGSIRSIIGLLNPKKYVGVDISMGPGVDMICDVSQLVDTFGEKSFDIVIATELMEHVRNWKGAISNIKRVCKPGGLVIITTRSYGFGFHAYPYDFWRYEEGDMKEIFSDFDIITLQKDAESPGIFITARRKETLSEKNLDSISLFSMVLGKRVSHITDEDLHSLHLKKLIFKMKIREFGHRFIKFIYSIFRI